MMISNVCAFFGPVSILIFFIIVFCIVINPIEFPIRETFKSPLCSNEYKVDSLPDNIFFENQDNTQYTTELKNKELMKIFKTYHEPKQLNDSLMTLDVDRLSSRQFAFYLKDTITQWFFEKTNLKHFQCILVVPKIVHKYDKYDNVEPNENVSFTSEALIHRQSKNIGKHLLIRGEIIQNKLHINYIRILGSVYHDNLYLPKYSTFTSTPATYLSIYDYYLF